MLLSARMMDDVGNVNTFEFVSELKMASGDQTTVYLQLTDKSVEGQLHPPGRRYVPASGATLAVLLNNVWQGAQITKVASQPFPGDLSMWSFTIAQTDKVYGTIDLILTLNEGGLLRTGRVKGALWIDTPETPLCQG